MATQEAVDSDCVDGNLMSSRNNPRIRPQKMNDEANPMYPDPNNPAHQAPQYYNMNHEKRGYALIFNHYDFDPKLKKLLGEDFITPRAGTEKDVERLNETLTSLSFKVRVFNDRTVAQIDQILRKYKRKNLSKCDCFMIVILSHGDEESICAFDAPYKINELMDKLAPDECRGLDGKPKILVAQTCRGKHLEQGWLMQTDSHGGDRKMDLANGNVVRRIPRFADFLVARSTVYGQVAFRDTEKGSVYIRMLCECLDHHAAVHDVVSILTMVNERVAVEFQSSNGKVWYLDQKKQMPIFESTLRRLLKFSPKCLEQE